MDNYIILDEREKIDDKAVYSIITPAWGGSSRYKIVANHLSLENAEKILNSLQKEEESKVPKGELKNPLTPKPL